jgi:hypothetical protein
MKKYNSLKVAIAAAAVLGAASLAGCVGVGNYEAGATKTVATSVVVRQAKTGNYEIWASGLRKSPSPDTIILVSRGASFNDTSVEFRKYNVPSAKLENLIYDLGGTGGGDSGGTELFLPDGTKAGYFVPKCDMCDLNYNKKTGQFEISAPGGDLGGSGGGGGGGAGGGGGSGGGGGGGSGGQ